MPIFSAMIVRRPRKRWCCANCGWEDVTQHVRLFGNAEVAEAVVLLPLRYPLRLAAQRHAPAWALLEVRHR